MNQKDEIKKIVDRIDQSQLSNESTESTDYEPITTDPAFPEYGVLDPVADGDRPYANADPVIPKSMTRFCKSHEIDEGAIRRNEGMKLNQKKHSPADGE
jgi:hypothetical protein